MNTTIALDSTELNQTKDELEKLIREFVAIENELLSRGRVERNFTAGLATFLSSHYKNGDIIVDAFYNRHGMLSKKIGNKLIEADIVIHQQGIDDNNLVIIELETNNHPERDDIWKLEEMTQTFYGYQYKLGLYFAVGVGNRAGEILSLEWYKNGKIIKEEK
ncbi:MAG: hypothetical protein LBM97_02405 [Candidatus Nomurabacteria bacterium]|jgi:hypothetical protein|nr:hypothetical protein [Candidatus Nomurabacteria bacterium]